MWICRYCAAHVAEEVLQCPKCGQPAPARLQPHLAENVSPEPNETRHFEEFQRPVIRGLGPYQRHWYRNVAGLGALVGLVLGLLLNYEARDAWEYYFVLFIFAGVWALSFVAITYLLLTSFYQPKTHLPSKAVLRTTDSLGHKIPLSESELADKITQGEGHVSARRDADPAIQQPKDHIAPQSGNSTVQ